MWVREALHIITFSEGLSHPDLWGCANSSLCRERQIRKVAQTKISSRRHNFALVLQHHPLVSSWLLVWNLWNIVLNTENCFRMIYCIKTIGTSRGMYSGYHLFAGPMCAPIPPDPLLNTQGNECVGVNMYYLFLELRVRSDTKTICSISHILL